MKTAVRRGSEPANTVRISYYVAPSQPPSLTYVYTFVQLSFFIGHGSTRDTAKLFLSVSVSGLDQPRQIRLLKLSYKDGPQLQMCCSFLPVSLDDLQVAYQAVSYFWGDSTPAH
jgi:hypothetical protein